MKVFAGRYSWDGKKHDEQDPIAWFPGSYNLKIFRLVDKGAGVRHLKPYICIYSKTGEGMSISENPEKFAKKVCNDFSMEIEKVLWAEELGDNTGDFDVVMFTKSGQIGATSFYNMEKRKPLKGEKKLIDKHLRELVLTQ